MYKKFYQSNFLLRILITTFCALLSLGNVAHARSIGGQIVNNISVNKENNNIEITVEFVLPVQYQWRFPKGFNDQIMIALLPVKRDPSLPVEMREDLRVPDEIADLFQEIYIDGTEGTNLLLFLRTVKEISPDIKQARGINGIIISLAKDQIRITDDSECDINPKKE